MYEYVPRMRESASDELLQNLPDSHPNKKTHTRLVSLSGHLFDDFLINEALDRIEAAGGTFRLVKCHVGQIQNLKYVALNHSHPNIFYSPKFFV